MKKIFFSLVVMVGVVGGMYGTLARLNGMGLYYLDWNSFSYGQVVDDPIFIIENGSLLYRLSNEVALEPYGVIYSGDWRTAFGYGLFHTPWVSVALFVNMFPWEEDMFDKYHDSDIAHTPNYPGGVAPSDYSQVVDQDKSPWFDLVVGTQKLPFSPYVGFSLVAANYTKTQEHIPTPVDPTKSIVYTEESAYLFKLRAGATFDILSLLSLDTGFAVLFPSGKVQTKTTMTEIANYKNEKTLASDGNIGFEGRVYPRLKFGPSLEWKSDIVYRFWKIDSKFSTAIDLNGDGDYVDLGENKQSDNHPYNIHVVIAGTGVDYHTEKMRLFVSIHNLFQFRSEEWFVVDQSTGTDVYFDKETASGIMNHIIINGGGEFFLKPWFAFRFGMIAMRLLLNTTQGSYTYSGTTETSRDVSTVGEISNGLLGQLGVSLSLGQFTFDWTMSDKFIAVLGHGAMPYLLSGTVGHFDEFSMLVSMSYHF